MTPDEITQVRIAAAIRAHQNQESFGTAANAAAVASGTEAIKALLLINGGSCVAVLAFIGSLATKTGSLPSDLAAPLFCFALGAALAVSAAASGYFTNLYIVGSSQLMERRYDEPFLKDTPRSERCRLFGEIWRYVSVICAFAALVAFVLGTYLGYKTLGNLQPAKIEAQSCWTEAPHTMRPAKKTLEQPLDGGDSLRRGRRLLDAADDDDLA